MVVLESELADCTNCNWIEVVYHGKMCHENCPWKKYMMEGYCAWYIKEVKKDGIN